MGRIDVRGDTLETLALIDNEKLTFVSGDILSSLRIIRSITIRGSPLLTTLPDADGPKPTQLDISYNGLKDIPSMAKMGERIQVRYQCQKRC